VTSLSSVEIARFLDVGYLVLQLPDVAEEIHDRIFDKCESLYQGVASIQDSDVGLNLIADNINTTIPELNQILGSEQVDGALTSLLGKEYFRYNHSFIHRAGTNDQSYHKDSGLPWGTRNGIRSHRLNWAMIFYYPQATTMEMGATEILPGTQYWSVDREGTGATEGEDRLDYSFESDKINGHPDLTVRDSRLLRNVEEFDHSIQPLKLEIPKGSVVLVHFDLIHRGTRLAVQKSRYMAKFWFLRTTEPRGIEIRAQDTYQCEDGRRALVLDSCLKWLKVPALNVQAVRASCSSDHTEGDLVERAYKLATQRDPILLEEFASTHEAKRRTATQALCTQGTFGLDTALSNTQAASPTVRMSGAFLLGEVADLEERTVSILLDLASSDPEKDVRVTSINAIGRIVRRSSNLNGNLLSRVFETLYRVIKKSDLTPTRRRIQQDAERQVAYIALLTSVSVLDAKRHQKELHDLGEFLSSVVSSESDRYAKGTAVEIVCRLAKLGIRPAVNCAVALLRDERVNSFVH